MLVGGGFARVAHGVAPDAVLAADTVEHVFAGEGIEGAIDGDGIGVRGEFFEDVDGSQGAGGAGEDFEHAGADGGAAELGAFEEFGDGFVLLHEPILQPAAGQEKSICEMEIVTPSVPHKMASTKGVMGRNRVANLSGVNSH